MTNDEFLMTKEIEITNHKNTREPRSGRLSFRLRHSFGIRHSTFVICARYLLALSLLLCVSCTPGKRITKANVDEVEEGMSKKQVESILGRPSSITNEDLVIMKKTTYLYRQGKDSVTIIFKDDKVQSKESTLSN